MKHRKTGFTLIEMLVVIAIIGILASMLFPAIMGAMRSAKKNTARQECLSIAAAINMYINDYGKLPVPDAQQARRPDFRTWAEDGNPAWKPMKEDQEYWSDDNFKRIIQVLIAANGGDNAGHVLNPTRKVYLAMDKASPDGTLQDPWGTQYAIKLDRDYDGKLEYFSNPRQHLARVVVASAGPDRDFGTGTDNLASVTIE